MKGSRNKLIDALAIKLVESDIPVNRKKIKGFLKFHTIKTPEDLGHAFPEFLEFLSQYRTYEAMI